MARKDKVATPTLPTRENLEALVEEINSVLNLEPAIKFSKKTTDAELVELIKAEVVGNVYEIDFTPDAEDETIPYFTEESKADFAALSIEILAGSPPVEGEEAPEEEPEPVAVAPKGKGKGKAKVEEAPVKPVAKPAAKAAAKPAPAKADKAAKPAPTKPAKAASTAEKFTRNNALVAALLQTTKTPMTKQEVCELSDAIYVKHGGSTGAFVSEVMYRYAVPALIELGVIEKTGDKIKLLP